MLKYNQIMISTFDIKNLNTLLQDFYTVVGIRISIFDDAFNLVTEYPETAPRFCRNIRSTREGLKACHDCDMAACMRAKKLRKPHIYTCHAGITEAITPIQIGRGVLGYAILAHMLSAEDYAEAVDRVCTLAEGYGVPRAKSLIAVSDISKRTMAEINAAVRLLDAVSSYVYISNLAQWRNDDISASLDRFIRDNLSETLNSRIICSRFNFSRSSLYQFSLRAFGMGIMQYISFCRIERAKELLSSGESIARTAELCGFSEYNYFCKMFKKSTGYSPSDFKNKNK